MAKAFVSLTGHAVIDRAQVQFLPKYLSSEKRHSFSYEVVKVERLRGSSPHKVKVLV